MKIPYKSCLNYSVNNMDPYKNKPPFPVFDTNCSLTGQAWLATSSHLAYVELQTIVEVYFFCVDFIHSSLLKGIGVKDIIIILGDFRPVLWFVGPISNI